MLRIILRHISGSRATELDVIQLGAHRELILGRAHSAAVRFDARDDAIVGRQHARITRDAIDPGRLMLSDLRSRNGTFLNGEPVAAATEIKSGDIVRLGTTGPVLEILIERSLSPGSGSSLPRW
jgi:pSer/pThr/pTyr-binding forkhead associated (FHA) protein